MDRPVHKLIIADGLRGEFKCTCGGPATHSPECHKADREWMDWAEREMRLLKKQLTDTQELLDEAQGVGEPDDG